MLNKKTVLIGSGVFAVVMAIMTITMAFPTTDEQITATEIQWNPTVQGDVENTSQAEPTPITIGDRGFELELDQFSDNPLFIQNKQLTKDLGLSMVRANTYGDFYVFYSSPNERINAETTLREFVSNGGMIVKYETSPSNFDKFVENRPDMIVSENRSYYGVDRVSEDDLPSKLYIPSDNGILITITADMPLSEIVSLYEKLK